MHLYLSMYKQSFILKVKVCDNPEFATFACQKQHKVSRAHKSLSYFSYNVIIKLRSLKILILKFCETLEPQVVRNTTKIHLTRYSKVQTSFPISKPLQFYQSFRVS